MSAVQSLRASYICTGILLTLEGFLFLLFPHVATKLLMVAPLRTAQAEQYARAVGLGIAIVGYYYIVAGKYTLLDFYRYENLSWTSLCRQILFYLGLVSLDGCSHFRSYPHWFISGRKKNFWMTRHF